MEWGNIEHRTSNLTSEHERTLRRGKLRDGKAADEDDSPVPDAHILSIGGETETWPGFGAKCAILLGNLRILAGRAETDPPSLGYGAASGFWTEWTEQKPHPTSHEATTDREDAKIAKEDSWVRAGNLNQNRIFHSYGVRDFNLSWDLQIFRSSGAGNKGVHIFCV